MMSPESNKRIKDIEEFQRISKNYLQNPDGSYATDMALQFFVDQYLTPTFYNDYPELWREGLKTLYNHVGKSICGTRLVTDVFGREGEIEINGETVLVRQIDIIREDEDSYVAGIEILKECSENNPSSLSGVARKILSDIAN